MQDDPQPLLDRRRFAALLHRMRPRLHQHKSTRGAFLDVYIAKRTGINEPTHVLYDRVQQDLVTFLGAAKPLREVTERVATNRRIQTRPLYPKQTPAKASDDLRRLDKLRRPAETGLEPPGVSFLIRPPTPAVFAQNPCTGNKLGHERLTMQTVQLWTKDNNF
jgi:hypothetical protein